MNQSIIAVASEGGGAHAIDVMARASNGLVRAVRRAVPFLGRRRIVVEVSEPQLTDTENVGSELQSPAHVTHMVVEPGGGRARLCFDAPAISFLLDGSLCGDGTKAAELAESLTPPQQAFIEQLSQSLVAVLSPSLEYEVGLAVKPFDVRSGQAASGAVVALKFKFVDDKPDADEASDDDDDEFLFDDDADEDDDNDDKNDDADAAPKEHGCMVLAISKSALMSARIRGRRRRDDIDDRVKATMEEVTVQVVAELGRVVMSVAQLANLRVGHTLRVPVAVNGAVAVRVEDVPVFKGRPTTSGSQLAIRIMDDAVQSTTLMPEHAPEELHESLPPATAPVDLHA